MLNLLHCNGQGVDWILRWWRQRYAANKDQIAERGKLYREANINIVKESKRSTMKRISTE